MAPIGESPSTTAGTAPKLILAAEPVGLRSNTGPALEEPGSETHNASAGPAFAQFYRAEHEGQVRRAFLLLGSEAAAHDVVADAFLKVYRKWDAIDTPGPYLNRCVLNECRDAHRTTKREVPTDLGVDQASDSTVGANDPVEHIADLLADLPFRQRAAIVLRFYGHQSEAEIADYLDCRPGTVGSLIHRALKTLKKDLA